MLKSAGLLLFVGLAIGLWLGFNPQAHQKVVQNWNEAKAATLSFQSQISTKFKDWTALWNPKSSGKVSVSVSKPISTAWRQLGSIFNVFWSSLHKLWLSLTSGLQIPKG